MQQYNNGRNQNRRTSANRENRGNGQRQYRGCCFWKKRTRLDDTEQVSPNSRAKGPGKSTSDQFVYRRPERSTGRCLGNVNNTRRSTASMLSKDHFTAVRSGYAARNGCKRSSSFTHARFSTKGRTLKQGFVLEDNVGQVHAFRWNIMGRFEEGNARVHKKGSVCEVREATYRGKRVVFKRVSAKHRLAKREFVAWNLLCKNRYTKAVTALLLDSFCFEGNYYFVSYAYDCDFFYYLKKKQYTSDVFHILLQIANAIVVLHSFDLAHLDIKPENILIRGSYAVLCDFATVYRVKDLQKIAKEHGTYEYCAPEMLDCIISTKSDVYSFTKTVFVALEGYFPNTDSISSKYGDMLMDVYLSGLKKDPTCRCSSVELYKKLYVSSLLNN